MGNAEYVAAVRLLDENRGASRKRTDLINTLGIEILKGSKIHICVARNYRGAEGRTCSCLIQAIVMGVQIRKGSFRWEIREN